MIKHNSTYFIVSLTADKVPSNSKDEGKFTQSWAPFTCFTRRILTATSWPFPSLAWVVLRLQISHSLESFPIQNQEQSINKIQKIKNKNWKNLKEGKEPRSPGPQTKRLHVWPGERQSQGSLAHTSVLRARASVDRCCALRPLLSFCLPIYEMAGILIKPIGLLWGLNEAVHGNHLAKSSANTEIQKYPKIFLTFL